MRKPMQDMKPAKKGTTLFKSSIRPRKIAIRTIKTEKTAYEPKKIVRKSPITTPPVSVDEYTTERGGNGARFVLWLIAFISVVILFFALSLLFSGAKVTITPKMGDFVLDDAFTARKDASSGELSFEVIALSGVETTLLLATDIKEIERRASGRVIIYNTYSSKPQNLSIETRLETPDGKIYKTESVLIVPGAIIEEGETIPGSVEVTVRADLPGEEYNIDFTDFTIVGFKGTAKYEKFYARSKTEITGGLRGQMHIVSSEEGQQAVLALRQVLSTRLKNQIAAQTPPGFVVFDDSIYISTESTEFFESEEESIPLVEKGTLYAFIFDESELAKAVSEAVVSQFEGSDVTISNLGDIAFQLTNKEQVSPEKDTAITFSLSGQAKIVWDIDEEGLKSDLVGRHKREFQIILSDYKNIDRAEVVIKPFWKKTFPDKIKDIKIINTVSSPDLD